jgi:tRNA(Leu) C34 or U34 (ribose-2'-O)-methylase TrmL
LELLKQKGWIIGGEGSGHLLCLDQHSTGDGTIAALQVLYLRLLIPGTGAVESLNVSVACGILLGEVWRRQITG